MSSDGSGTYRGTTPTTPAMRRVQESDTKRGHEDPTEVRCPTCAGKKVCPTCGNRGHVPLDVAAGIEDEAKRRERCECK